MKNKELFDRTVAVLVQAYRNDTLRHGSCRACAVGNMVAAALGITDVFNKKMWMDMACGSPDTLNGWSSVFTTINGIQDVRPDNELLLSASKQISSTGYHWRDLAKIEFAFETAEKGENDDDWMLNGLLSVYDCLCEIHEVDKNEVTAGEEVFTR